MLNYISSSAACHARQVTLNRDDTLCFLQVPCRMKMSWSKAALEEYLRHESSSQVQHGQNVSGGVLAAICKAAEAPDAKGLLALLTSPEVCRLF